MPHILDVQNGGTEDQPGPVSVSTSNGHHEFCGNWPGKDPTRWGLLVYLPCPGSQLLGPAPNICSKIRYVLEEASVILSDLLI